MADIRIDASWRDHPKRRKLQRRLGAEAVVAIQDLWLWVGEQPSRRATGSLAGLDSEDIAIAAQWDGDPDAFVSECVALRLIDETNDGLALHQWCDWQPFLVGSKARSEAAKKANDARWSRYRSSKNSGKRRKQKRIGAVSESDPNRTPDASAPDPLPTDPESPYRIGSDRIGSDLIHRDTHTAEIDPPAPASATDSGASVSLSGGLMTAGQAMERLADAGIVPVGGSLHPQVAALAPWHPDEVEVAIAAAQKRGGRSAISYGCGAVRNMREERDHAPRAGPMRRPPQRVDPVTQSYVTATVAFLGEDGAQEFFGGADGPEREKSVSRCAAAVDGTLQQASGRGDTRLLVGGAGQLPAARCAGRDGSRVSRIDAAPTVCDAGGGAHAGSGRAAARRGDRGA